MQEKPNKPATSQDYDEATGESPGREVVEGNEARREKAGAKPDPKAAASQGGAGGQGSGLQPGGTKPAGGHGAGLGSLGTGGGSTGGASSGSLKRGES
jgi:hypothetical protein